MNRSAIAVILRAELLAWRNRIRTGNRARIVLLGIFGSFAALVFGGSLFGVAVAAAQFIPSARDAILAGAFTALSVLMLVVGFPTVIAAFFAGRDLMQLVIAPVRTGEIFIARSLFAMSANVLLALIFLTFIAGLGAGSGASPLYYVLAVILVFVQVLLITSLQATFMAAVLRWVPARLARDIAVAVASITGAGLYLVWNIALRQNLSPRRDPNISGVVSLFQGIQWVPSTWPGHALNAIIGGNGAAALAWTGLTLALAAVLVSAAALLYERTLLAGLGLLGGVPATWRIRSRAPEHVARSGVGSPGFAIARKDWIAYRRDIRRLSRFLPAMLFLVAYAFVLLRPPKETDVFWNDVFIVAFVSLFMSMMFATPSIPAERRGFQLLRLAPITFWQLIRTKVLFAAVPVVGLVTVISLATSIAAGNGLPATFQIVVFAVWLGLGCVCIAVSAGAIDPRFESTDDRRAVGVLGTFVAIGGEVGFGLLSVGAFALLHIAPDLAAGRGGFGVVPATAVAAAAFVVTAILLAAGGAALVGLILWSANSHLKSFEGAITTA